MWLFCRFTKQNRKFELLWHLTKLSIIRHTYYYAKKLPHNLFNILWKSEVDKTGGFKSGLSTLIYPSVCTPARISSGQWLSHNLTPTSIFVGNILSGWPPPKSPMTLWFYSLLLRSFWRLSLIIAASVATNGSEHNGVSINKAGKMNLSSVKL